MAVTISLRLTEREADAFLKAYDEGREGWHSIPAQSLQTADFKIAGAIINARAGGDDHLMNTRPGFFPNGQCRHYQLVDGWAKVWCTRTDEGHTEHETEGGQRWSTIHTVGDEQ